jgi:hypothetical protein
LEPGESNFKAVFKRLHMLWTRIHRNTFYLYFNNYKTLEREAYFEKYKIWTFEGIVLYEFAK